MKPWMKAAVMLGVAAILGTLITFIVLKSKANAEAGKRIEKIPPFEVWKLDSTRLTSKDIPPGVQAIFIYFNTECEHCMGEVKELVKDGSLLKDYMVIMVSSEALDTLRKFSAESGLEQYPFIHITSDRDDKWKDAFRPTGSPVNYIYDRNRKLIKKVSGESKASYLHKLAQGK